MLSSVKRLARRIGLISEHEANGGFFSLPPVDKALLSLLPTAPKTSIELTRAEIQSNFDRVRWAELLIRQLPEDHDGRNSWLFNYAKDAPARPEFDEVHGLQVYDSNGVGYSGRQFAEIYEEIQARSGKPIPRAAARVMVAEVVDEALAALNAYKQPNSAGQVTLSSTDSSQMLDFVEGSLLAKIRNYKGE